MSDQTEDIGLEEMKAAFRNLPMRLMQRWWEWTYYSKHPATNELMWTIEAIDPDLAVHLALGDAERIEQTWGEKKSKTRKLSAEEETKVLISAVRSCGGRGEDEAPGAEDICADMVKVIMAWRRGNLAPRWEVPALRALCKDFDPPDTYF